MISQSIQKVAVLICHHLPKSESILMLEGEELTDAEINYTQRLLKAKHPKVNGLRSTLYQGKVQEIENSVQVIYYLSRFHWITVTTLNCKAEEVRVFDSAFTHCDKPSIDPFHVTRKLHKKIIFFSGRHL